MPKRPPVTGQQLIEDFRSAIMSIATSQAAQFEAQRSENAMVEHLRTLSSGYYLQPGALAVDNQEAVNHASLDAHIKKVQAEQIQQLNVEQLQALQLRSRTDFLKRKVRLSVIDSSTHPLESIWFDAVTGYRNSVNKRRIVTGVIDDILLDRNALVIKPIGMTRMFNQSLHGFVVYVMNPTTLQPAVEITIL